MATATIKLAGFEFRPTADFLSDLQQFAQDPSKPAPQFARPVFTDPEGNRLLAIPSRDGILGVPVTTAPEVESPHAAGPRGGFVRAQPDPPAGSPPGGADMQALFRGMAQDLALKTGGAALSQAVVAAMTGAAPGGALSGAMNALGMSVPGMFGSLASQAVQSLGLGGLGGTAGQLAGQAATSLATSLMGGDPGALLSQLGNALGGSAGASAATAAQNLMQGGCFGGAAKGPSLGDLGVSALSGAADKALDLWKIDDESSAAETVAKSLVTKYKDQLKQLGMDPDAFLEKINAFFNGAAVGTGKFAVRQTDKDDKVDISAVGVANILVEKKPISRIGDKLAPSGKPILMGSPTVLSAGVPTAFLTVPTGVPSMMVMGAPTVLVGIPPGMAIPAPAPDTADPNSAKAPEKPESPQGGAAKGSSAKGGTGDGAPGDDSSSEKTAGSSDPSGGENTTPANPNSDDSSASKPLTDEERRHQESLARQETLQKSIDEAAGDPGRQAELQSQLEQEASQDRNWWQRGLCPENRPLPGSGSVTDTKTGTEYSRPLFSDPLEYVYGHAGNDCFRGTGPFYDQYKNDPAYQNWLKNLQATTPSGNQLTANNTTGGIQCCYDDTTGKLDSSSASAGTYDAASPQTSMTDHRTLDVNRDPGNYHIYNQSSGQNAVPPTPRPTPPPIPTPPPVPAPTPAANNSGNPVPQPVPTSTPKPY